jgi:predicted Zn-dependent protease
MGVAAYEQMKQETPISDDRATNAYVRCVADAILNEIPQAGGNWELTVFEDYAVNAFALPGGTIGVYTGLLKVADGQDQLAAVIGHEIAHVIADHGNARISAAYAAQTGLQLAQAVAGAPTAQRNQLWGLLGLGVQAGVLLPYGRGQESEADMLGIEYMARAGFDPGASVLLWQNMSKAGGAGPPEFLSTHPSHETRISDLKNAMPAAKQLYKQAAGAGKRPRCR